MNTWKSHIVLPLLISLFLVNFVVNVEIYTDYLIMWVCKIDVT